MNRISPHWWLPDLRSGKFKTVALLLPFLFSLRLVQQVQSQIFIANYTAGTIGKYTTSGAAVNTSLVTGLSNPSGLVTDGTNLFVSNFTTGALEYTLSGDPVNTPFSGAFAPLALQGNDLFAVDASGTVGEFTTSGNTLNPAVISLIGSNNEPDDIQAIAVDGEDLFVSYALRGVVMGVVPAFKIGEYTTSGGTVNASLLSGSGFVLGLAVEGDDLFVANGLGAIGDYSIPTTTWNPSLITGLDSPYALAINGNDLFVANSGNGTIGEYTTSGDMVSPALISGLTGNIYGLAVVPEPATPGLFALTGVVLLMRRRSTHPLDQRIAIM